MRKEKLNGCASCKVLKENNRILDKHNLYLQRLIDRLLVRVGTEPVRPVKEEPEPPTEEEKITADGGEVIGE